MSAYDVVDCGPDTSGRRVLMNRRMKAAWDLILSRLDFVPVIVQGAYMARQGGGADASEGYHDQGGCLDWRTWNLTTAQVDRLVFVAADAAGWVVWRRDERHGMDPHAHGVLLGDADAASGALDQMAQFRNGQNGLSNRGPDYERRPADVTVFDYDRWLEEEQEMQLDDKIGPHSDVRDALQASVETNKRVAKVISMLGGIVDALGEQATDLRALEKSGATREQVQKLHARANANRARLLDEIQKLEAPDAEAAR